MSLSLGILVFLLIVAFVGLMWYSTKKNGGLRNAIKVLMKDGAMSGILGAIIGTFLVTLLLSLIYSDAEAAEVKLFERTTVFAGLDYDVNNQVFCESSGTDDRLTSNIGVRQHLISINRVQLLGTYTHHSCALNTDKPTYDAVGISVEYTFRR